MICVKFHLHLQEVLSAVLQAGIIFHAINWRLFFYIPEKKGPLLMMTVIQTYTTSQNTKLLHILCTSII